MNKIIIIICVCMYARDIKKSEEERERTKQKLHYAILYLVNLKSHDCRNNK
jgi:hypothetical protein